MSNLFFHRLLVTSLLLAIVVNEQKLDGASSASPKTAHSRNKLKEMNVEISLECQEEIVALERELNSLKEALLIEARDMIYQPPGSLFAAGSSPALQYSYDAKKAVRDDIKKIREKVREDVGSIRSSMNAKDKNNCVTK